MSELQELFSRHHDILCEKAAEAGIDWLETSHMVHGAGTYKKPATYREKDSKRSFVHVHQKEKGWLINFRTFDDGRGGGAVSCYLPYEERVDWQEKLKKMREERQRLAMKLAEERDLERRLALEAEAAALEVEAARQEAMEAALIKRELEAKKRRDGERKKLEAEDARKKKEAAAKREADWRRDRAAFEAAPRLNVDFPYLVQKNIPQLSEFFDVREMTAKRQFGQGSDEVFLAYALRDAAGNYVGLKRIWANGKKKLSTGRKEGSYKGAFTVIANPSLSLTLYVAEGLATAVSIFLATGCAVYIADSAGNLDEVVRIVKRQNHGKRVVLVADNDIRSADKMHLGNTGVYLAMTAAKEHKASFVIIPSTDNQKTDANDYAQKFGNAALCEALKENVEKPGAGADYALQILRFAPRSEQKKYIEDYVRSAFVGWRTPAADAAKFLESMTGGMVTVEFFTRTANAFLRREREQAKKLLEVNGVDIRESYFLTQNEQGHWAVPEEVLEKIKEHHAKNRMVILRAPPGTGKTERVISVLMRAADGTAALALPRVATIEDISRRIKVAHYREVRRDELRVLNRVVLCVNSMDSDLFAADSPEEKHFLHGLNFFAMDEGKQLIIQCLRLGPHRRCVGNTMRLMGTINSARSVLVCDAFADQFTVDFLRKVDHRDIAFVDVVYPHGQGKSLEIDIADDKALVHKGFSSALERGETALLYTDSAKEARRIHRKTLQDGILQPHEILLISGTPDSAAANPIKLFASNPNAEMKKYKAIIYTPKIDAGLSITLPHFQNHFGIFTGTVPVQVQNQMMGRDRTAQGALIYFGDRSTRAAKLKLEADRAWVGGAPNLYDDLSMLANQSEILSLDNYRKLSMNFLLELSHRVRMLPKSEKDAAHNAEMIKIGKKLKEEDIDEVLNAAEISEEAYEKLMILDMRTNKQEAMARSFELREHLCGELLGSHVDFHLRGGLRSVKNLEAATSSESDVKDFDKSEEEDFVSKRVLFRAERRREIFLRVCMILGVDPRNGYQGEFRSDATESALQYLISEASLLNQLFYGIIDPKRPPCGAVQFLQKFFAQYGVRLGKRKSSNMIRFIDQSSLAFVMGFVDARRRRRRELIKQHNPDDVPLDMCGAPP